MNNGSHKRYTHLISLNEEQENKLSAVRLSTGFSIAKILMATVDALGNYGIEEETD